MATTKKVKLTDKRKKHVVATVRFYDKSAKVIEEMKCYERVPKAAQIKRILPAEFDNAVLVTCQAEPAKKAPLKVFKNVVHEAKISDAAKKKLKEVGADV